MPAPWDYCAETRYAPIDEDHRDIVRSIHLLIALVDQNKKGAELTAALDAVVEGVAAHFLHEERLMAQVHYEQTAEHKEAHASFLKDLKNFDAELRAKGPTEKFRLWAGGRLGSWFQMHIKTHDIALAIVLRQAKGRFRPG